MNLNQLKKEVQFRTSRSSGAGGQHVNKVSTKVDLIFDVKNSQSLTDQHKKLIFNYLKHRITKEGLLKMSCQKSRSQSLNRKTILEKFFKVIEKSLVPPKKRKAVKPLKAKKEARLQKKRILSEKKSNRKKVIFKKENDLSFFDNLLKNQVSYFPTFAPN